MCSCVSFLGFVVDLRQGDVPANRGNHNLEGAPLRLAHDRQNVSPASRSPTPAVLFLATICAQTPTTHTRGAWCNARLERGDLSGSLLANSHVHTHIHTPTYQGPSEGTTRVLSVWMKVGRL